MPALTSKGMQANWTATLAACPGCGAAIGDEDQDVEHRPDCTVEPAPLLCEDCGAIRLPSEKGGKPWQYRPDTRTYHCPTHQKGTK
ncbi:hypothetical protein MKUB_32850 [Mycobacterium kubicae]|uniref:Uncharacterized protein n=1 Tax=Mycobacterium kubicae TaxID=120959 RepID=A0AAX1JBY9_9MYCO|nr:hypothetical protein [Mycobacterium kubicae]MCV7095291.1 hypothetical protein [Mycobacterium kubicae]ORV97419.1 hypothetical protein AWC13_16535 [Mycobacterium kubicae]QNI14361.1 hypothetical protein GAN18_27735 [Mycobacterium kubicae]QPI37883.1 hypothetical protein I2456_27195 [Mycobacterium kubicae]GFG65795.1 hypothetical protein MKUB_32850 [Mycobacterium kubicae]